MKPKEMESIFRAIQAIIDGQKWIFDITRNGRITAIVNDNKYKVEVNGMIYTIKSNFKYEVNERVRVLFPNGSSTDLYLYPNK